MNIFDRITNKLGAFFRSLFSGQEENFSPEKTIQKQRASQKRLKESLTELVFQRKKLEAQIKKLDEKVLGLNEDLEMAAINDKDQLALHLMEELEMTQLERKETHTNLDLVTKEIRSGKQLEVELSQQIKKSESQLAVLASRSQSVKMRKDLQNQFTKIQNEMSYLQPGLSDIEENILKVEAQLESLRGDQDSWKDEVSEMRKQRRDRSREVQLQQLKTKLKGKSLPGRVIIPDLVTTT